MVMAPAKTGRESNSKIAVTRVAQVKRGMLCRETPGARMLIVVTMKLMAPKVLLIPARCSAKMAMSTEAPLCDCSPDNGGYKVHPVPAPCSRAEDSNKRTREGGRSHKEMLFKRGNAISTAPIWTGKR